MFLPCLILVFTMFKVRADAGQTFFLCSPRTLFICMTIRWSTTLHFPCNWLLLSFPSLSVSLLDSFRIVTISSLDITSCMYCGVNFVSWWLFTCQALHNQSFMLPGKSSYGKLHKRKLLCLCFFDDEHGCRSQPPNTGTLSSELLYLRLRLEINKNPRSVMHSRAWKHVA